MSVYGVCISAVRKLRLSDAVFGGDLHRSAVRAVDRNYRAVYRIIAVVLYVKRYISECRYLHIEVVKLYRSVFIVYSHRHTDLCKVFCIGYIIGLIEYDIIRICCGSYCDMLLIREEVELRLHAVACSFLARCHARYIKLR